MREIWTVCLFVHSWCSPQVNVAARFKKKKHDRNTDCMLVCPQLLQPTDDKTLSNLSMCLDERMKRRQTLLVDFQHRGQFDGGRLRPWWSIHSQPGLQLLSTTCCCCSLMQNRFDWWACSRLQSLTATCFWCSLMGNRFDWLVCSRLAFLLQIMSACHFSGVHVKIIFRLFSQRTK